MEKLDEVRKRISAAKQELFRAQDVAADIGDAELLEELRKARHRLEAADRRQGALRWVNA